MPFVPYFGLTLTARRVSKRQKRNVDISALLLETAQVMAMMGRGPDLFTAAIEHQHYFSAHRVLLVTKELAEALYESRIDFCLKHLVLPYSACEVNFEQGCLIPGTSVQVPGVLVMAKPSDAMMDSMGRFIKKASGGTLDREVYRKTFSMRYTMAQCGLPDELRTTYALNVDFEKDGDKEIEEVIKSAPDLVTVDAPLSPSEKKEQAAILKMVVGVLCYLSIDGSEKEDWKVFDRPRMGERPSCLLLGRTYREVPRHMRKGHIRRLRHERYRRDDEGNVRTVWIKEHEVGTSSEKELPPKKEVVDVD